PLLVPRRLRLPVRERIDAQGEVLVPLDESSVARAIDALAAQHVEAVAVGLLHSFTNPDHERRVGDAIGRRLPQLAVTLSCEGSPEMREYERFSTPPPGAPGQAAPARSPARASPFPSC